ncbi:hypothetical protein ABDK56_11010 [Sphingomonas sp. ASV193]|uniref:hypothetical protein n=1 Tax=Sphingomonas sp. ASV193 TaxID=3144405 RepID=UPI0032E8D572
MALTTIKNRVKCNLHPGECVSLDLPNLELTHGQLLWSIRYGRHANQRVKDQVRYLRELDIPASAKAQARGPGSRITYDFYDLVEIGLAIAGLDIGFRPNDIAAVIAGNRDEMRKAYARNWQELAPEILQQSWVRSQGRETPILLDETFLRLHERRSEQWGQIDFVGPDEASDELPIFEPIERFAGDRPRRLIPLKRLMIQWVAWAMEAPPTKPGPVGRQS